MSIANQIASKRNKDRRVIEVPEWGDDAPVLLYVGAITAGDMDRLQRKHKDFLNNMTIAGMIDLIIAKAETKDGDRVFTLEDKPVLMREPVNLIADIAGKMFGDIESVEEQEKN
jgi:hypothetical protein